MPVSIRYWPISILDLTVFCVKNGALYQPIFPARRQMINKTLDWEILSMISSLTAQRRFVSLSLIWAVLHTIGASCLILRLIWTRFAVSEITHPSCCSSSSDPLQSVLQTLERQHEEEKRCALERQRQLYEQELQQLRQRLNPEKPSHFSDASAFPVGATAVASTGYHKRVRRWSEDR